jgi:hypothetical protein
MQLDKQFLIDELRKQGQNEHVQKAIQELPDKIDHEQHAGLLTKVGIDPGKLLASAIERGYRITDRRQAFDSAISYDSDPLTKEACLGLRGSSTPSTSARRG